jgi:hypothetical protein
MGTYFLKNTDKELYLKSIDTLNAKIEFTDKQNEAKQYQNGEWFAVTELEYLMFHFPQEKEILNNMHAVYEEIRGN